MPGMTITERRVDHRRHTGPDRFVKHRPRIYDADSAAEKKP